MKSIKHKTLQNGLTIVHAPSAGKSTTVLVLVGAGSLNETPEKNGISHFLEHMCFKGTDTKSGKDIMRYLDGLGAETNAFTSFEYTGYYVKSVHKHWKKTLAVVSDIYNDSVFPESEMETEKGVVLGEIAMYQDQPTSVVGDTFRALAYPDQMAGKTILGPAENIKNMQRQDFLDYRSTWYTPENTTIVVVGDVEYKKAVNEIEKHFSDNVSQKTPKITKIRVEKKPRIKVLEKKTEQTHVRIGYHAFGNTHKDIYAARMLSIILGGGMSSRLFERIREDLGMGYYVGAGMNTHEQAGFFEIAAGIDSSRMSEYLLEIRDQIQQLITDGVSETELKRAREYLLGNVEMGLEASDDVAYFLAKQHLFNVAEKLSDIKKTYKKLTTSDINRVAKKIFKDKNLFCALLGPHTKRQALGFLKKLSQK